MSAQPDGQLGVNAPVRVLLVEDVPTDAELEERELRLAGLRFVGMRAESLAECRAALPGFRPDVVLSDFRLRGATALDVIAAVHELAPGAPVIVVTGSVSEETAVECFNAGATDYVLKGHLQRLAPAVWSALEHRRAVDQRWRAERQEELALRASDDRHRALFRKGLDAVFVTDPATGTILDVNPRACELTGRPAEQLVGRHLEVLHPPETVAIARARFAEAARGLHLRAVPSEVLRADGSRVPVEISTEEFEDAAGRRFLIGVFRDVSERRQAASALLESEGRFSAVVEGASEGILVHSSGVIRYANEAAAAAFGAPNGPALVGRAVADLVHPAARDAARARIGRLYQRDEVAPFAEETLVRLDGTTFEAEIGMSPTRWAGENAALVIFRDITERRRGEAERRLLASALEQAADVAIVTDLKAKILFVNPAFERVTGYTRAEALGQSPRLLKSGVQPPETYRRLWEAIAAGRVFSDTFVNRRKNGTHYMAEVSIAPVMGSSGAPVGYVGLQRDVTQQHELREQLRQAQKMEAVGQLTGGIAHDFNNLLGVIITNAELLEPVVAGMSPESRAQLADLEGAAASGREMIRKLLAFSRRERLAFEPVSVRQALHDAVDTVDRLVPETIAVRVEAGPEDPVCRLDRSAFHQIVVNLVTNSRDALPDGGTVTCGVRAVSVAADNDPLLEHGDRPGEYACVMVSDDGTGMDAAVLGHAFEPFFTTKRVGEGTGLGLPMVFGLMKQHGGFVRIYSEPGAGTTVRLYFPLSGLQEPVPPESAAGAGTLARGSETILIVEDQEKLRHSIAWALESLGYRTLTAGDGEEALQVLAEHGGVQLVLTDLVMPRLGGLQLYRRLRAEGCMTPVVLMTGYAAISERDATPPDVPVIEKPWTMHVLAAKLREALERAAPEAGC